jgi:hypothetical protein
MSTLSGQTAAFRNRNTATASAALDEGYLEIGGKKGASICTRAGANQKSIGFGLSCRVAYSSGSLGSPFSHTSSIERFGENP